MLEKASEGRGPAPALDMRGTRDGRGPAMRLAWAGAGIERAAGGGMVTEEGPAVALAGGKSVSGELNRIEGGEWIPC